MPAYSATINVMVSAVRKAARGIVRDFGEIEQLQISQKGPANFVTNADIKAEKILREELEKARPGYTFVLEEGGVQEGPDKSHRWIIDPIDGTTNFMHGIPMVAISVALEREGSLVAGVVYNPIMDELFWAEKNKGAFLNDTRLKVSGRNDLKDAVVATGIPHLGRPGVDQFMKELSMVQSDVAGIRRFGSAALDLAWVAAGRFDGFWERNLSPWDLAAGILLVREAKGQVTDLEGGSDMLTNGSILATNGKLHPPMLNLLK